MSEKIEPKACPFCKAVGHNTFTNGLCDEGIRYFVNCWNCGAQGADALSEREAIEKWNHRPRDPAEVTSVTLDFSKMSEEDIQELHKLLDSRVDVTISSKFTTTELCQSIISWTRYDGTPETLPPKMRDVLVQKSAFDRPVIDHITGKYDGQYMWGGEDEFFVHIGCPNGKHSCNKSH